MTSLLAIAESMEQSGIGSTIAESRYWWPVLEGAHLLSLAVSFGLIVVTDLRLMGVFLTEIPLTEVLRALRPYVLWGFTATFATGGMVFWSEASTVIVSPLWAFKCILIVLGGLNALYFELVIARRLARPDSRVRALANARYAGAASLTIWSLAIVCGRLLAYLPR